MQFINSEKNNMYDTNYTEVLYLTLIWDYPDIEDRLNILINYYFREYQYIEAEYTFFDKVPLEYSTVCESWKWRIVSRIVILTLLK